jgi:hypothetical protein
MFDEATHNVLMKFLDKKSKEAEQEISKKGLLSEGHAIPLILKSQFNHIAHLDTELTAFRKQVDQRLTGFREEVDRRFEQVDKRFERLERNLFAGFGFLGFLITIYRFVH